MGNNHLALGLAQPSKCPGRGRTVTSSESAKWGVGRFDDGNPTRPWSVLLIRPTVNVHNWNSAASLRRPNYWTLVQCGARRDATIANHGTLPQVRRDTPTQRSPLPTRSPEALETCFRCRFEETRWTACADGDICPAGARNLVQRLLRLPSA